jgi:glycerol-3-phosphate dehydrogenase (NAD(P)+)
VRIAILGAGAWGTALAISLAARHEVAIWSRAGTVAALSSTRQSPYLPGFALPEQVAIERDLAHAVDGRELVIVASATSGLADICKAMAPVRPDGDLLWACKGFDPESHRLPHQVVAACLPGARRVGALSGPSFAAEVARGLPAAVVIASSDADFAAATAVSLNGERLRVYSSADLIGVELGGAVKNVIAIAAGISDGLELGLNARAALITRGLAEISRLGAALGGLPETFAGLAGLGDLVLTCTGALSRNREVGRQLAQGRALPDILAELGHVAEGVHSARAVVALSRARNIEMPICNAVHGVLFGDIPAATAVKALLSRDPRPEIA